MWRYLRAAFWLKVRLGILGELPLNAVLVSSGLACGFVNPGFWFATLGLEALYLATLATNQRFRRVIDAQDLAGATPAASPPRRESLVAGLDPTGRARLDGIERRVDRIIGLQSGAGAESTLLDHNHQVLERLVWSALRLLVARTQLASRDGSDQAKIMARIGELDRDLADPGLGEALRASKLQTRELQQRRLDAFAERTRALAEVDSDLDRIEAHLDLTMDQAVLNGRPSTLSLDFELGSSALLDPSLFATASQYPGIDEERPRRAAVRQ